MTNSSPRDI